MKVPTALPASAVPAPAPPRPGSALLFVLVIPQGSGVCIEGATIQIVRPEGAGEPFLQKTPCDVWSPENGGVLLKDLTPGKRVTLRGAASGYVPREMSFLPTPMPGSYKAVVIELSKAH